MAKSQQLVNDALYTATLDHTPASTDWVELVSANFFDLSGDNAGVLPAMEASEVYTLVLINATDAVGITYLKLGESNPADGVANCLAIPAGTVFSLGVRGHLGRNEKGVQTISVKLTTGSDTVKIVAQFDHDYT